MKRTRGVLLTVIVGLAFTLPGAGAGQQRTEGTSPGDRFVEIAKQVKLTPAFYTAMRKFENRYPRLVEAVRMEGLRFRELHPIWQGLKEGNPEVKARLVRYEAGEIGLYDIGLGKLGKDNPEDPQFSLQTLTPEVTCSQLTDIYYLGCIRGGGDPWMCFFLAEQYSCICDRSPGQDCGILPD